MSPRHAPQPLPLAAAESHRLQYPAQDPNGPLTTGGPVLSTPSARLASPPLSDSGRALGSAPDSRSRSPSSMTGIGIATSGETTTLQVVPSPTSSRSPRSPRSPVSKFNTSAKAQAVDGPGLSPSHSQTQAPSARATPSPSPSLPPPSHAGSVPESHIQSQQVSLHLPRSKYQARSARTVVTSGSVTPDPGDDDDDDFEDDYHQYQQQQARTEYSTRDEPPATTPTLIREGAGQFHFGIPQPQPQQQQQQPQQPQQPQQQQQQQQQQQPQQQPPPPPPPPPPAPSQQQPPHREEEKHSRSASRFFNFNKGPRLGNQNTGRYHSPSRSQNHLPIESSSEAMSRGTDYPSMSDRVSSKTSKYSDHSSAEPVSQKGAPPLPSRSDASIASGSAENDGPGSSKKSKPKPFNLLHRTRSMKDQESPSAQDIPAQVRIQEPEKAHTMSGQQPLSTAPVLPEDLDRSYRQMMNATPRNHSAERATPRAAPMNKDARSDKDHHAHNKSQPSSLHNTPGGSFFNGLRSSGTRAADMISKGLFGKSSRSGSTTEKEPVIDDEHYQLKVINLPLIEQTRITRISKRLEDSRDKTEFWMPAFPWRAIDYLNYKGCDVEGLYRVPGSGPQIKKWQRKFDEDFDVDLFAQDDLYDINIIGSMLKAWLRELPDELFPKEAQERIARECAGAEEVPQLLIDELSNLSPYNYYLLFAITCHLSLLLAHSDRNKMDFRNLCICFQPCMKIDAFCFRFLVCDWRQCWQGCKTEARYIEEEYMLFDQPPPKGLGAGGGPHPNGNGGGGGNGGASSGARGNRGGADDRNVSSSDSGKQSMQGHTANHYQGQQQQQQQQNGNGKLRKKSAPSNGSVDSTQSTVSSASIGGHNLETPRRSNEMRPLSPIKPLSPLGF